MSNQALIEVMTVKDFNDKLHAAKQSGNLTVVGFFTCNMPCIVMSPILQQLSNRFQDAIFIKVDLEDLKSDVKPSVIKKKVAKPFGIEFTPTFILMKGGNILAKVLGTARDELERKVTEHSGTAESSK